MTTKVDGSVPADQERKAPGRPRSARADEAIVEATLDLLAEGVTIDALSIEAVAARAGVGKATIYRRWANKETLIVDAVATVKGEPPQISGESIRADLLAVTRQIAHSADTRTGRILPCLLSQLRRNPELAKSYQRITEPRRKIIREVLRRGMESGELRPDLDIEITMSLITAPLVVQNVMVHNPALDLGDMAARLIDAVLPTIRAPRADQG